MSHNVELKNVKFKNLAILEAAVKELNAEGHQVEFVQGDNVQIRGWAGAMTRVPVAIICKAAQFDIGFNQNAEGDWVPVLEDLFNARGVGATVGTDVSGNACSLRGPEAQIGRLTQRYGVLMAERNARAQRMTTRRVYDQATGQIHLTCTAN